MSPCRWQPMLRRATLLAACLTVALGAAPAADPPAEKQPEAPKPAAPKPAPRPVAGEITNRLGDLGNDDQYTIVLKNILAAELHLVRKVCQPSDEQLAQCRAAGLEVVKTQVKMLVGNQGRVRGAGDNVEHPREAISKALAGKIDEVLSAEAAARYRAELAARDEFRREAALGMMMSNVDEELFLRSDQYEKVAAAIREKWQKSWSQNLHVYSYRPYAPRPDGSLINSQLTPQQQALWNGQPNHGTISFGFPQDLEVLNWLTGGAQVNLDDEAPRDQEAK